MEWLVRLLSRRGGIVALSAPAYASLFVIHLRNSLPSLLTGSVPPDLGYGAATSPTLQFLQIVCLAYLVALYVLTLWHWPRLNLEPRVLMWSAAACAVMAWTLLPAQSSDVLEYIGFGRLVGVYHLNPYVHTYSEITDEFASYVTWDEPMPYGPLVLPVYAAAGLLSSRHVLWAIYGIKAVWLVVHLLNAWLIYRLARSFAVVPELALFIFAFNPLILLEQPGNGHNDGLLILFALLAVTALTRGRDGLALWLALLSALVKASGLFWFAGIVALLIHRRRWRGLVEGVTASVASLAALFALLPGAWVLFMVMHTPWQYSEDSLHTLLIGGLGALTERFHLAWGYDEWFRADRVIFSTLLAGVTVWRLTAIRDYVALVRELGAVMLLLLLVYAASVHPWYVAWLLPIAALTDSMTLRRTILVFSAAVLILYAFPLALVEQAPAHALWSSLRLGLAFGIPIVSWGMEGITEPSGLYPVAVNVTSAAALESKVVSGGLRLWNRWEND